MDSLDADIVPGRCAGGFELGMNMTEVLTRISKLRDWDGEQQISEAIRSEDGWLRAFEGTESGSNAGGILFSPGGQIELRFNSKDQLYRIDVFNNTGKLFGITPIGKKLIDLQRYVATEYDVGDELHYPASESAINGIAFHTDGSSLDANPEQVVNGLSIFDWDLLDS
jgi:hypothetical protein